MSKAKNINWEVLDKMTEEEILKFEQEYKDKYLPKHRLYSIIPFNIAVGAMCYYYTVNFKKISKKYFKPKRFSLGEIFKYGTIQSVLFVSFYCLGMCSVTGLWHPIEYVRDIARIKGKIIDKALRHDEVAQKYILFDAMEYFGMSKEIIDTAKNSLNKEKQELTEKKFFTQETLDLLQPKKEEEDD